MEVYPKAKTSNIVVQELFNEVLIYELNRDQAFCLNRTSTLFWRECDGTKSVSEIEQIVAQKLNSAVSENLIWLALEQLKQRDLLENIEEISLQLNGLSRREAIRKAGLASIIALPLISAIVAPNAAHAQSGTCIPVFDPCDISQPNQCCAPATCVIDGSFNTTCQPS